MSEYGPTHNAEASKPLADWRDDELERLRRLMENWHNDLTARERQVETLERELAAAEASDRESLALYRACRDRADGLASELAEARGLLREARDVLAEMLREYELRARIDAFLAGEKPTINDCVVVGDGYCTTHKQDAFMCGPGKAFKWKEFAPEKP